MSTDPEPHHTSLSASLQAILAGESEKVTLEEIVNAIDDKQFGMLLILLSIPSALPVPAPGYSTPFGIAILILGVQMLLGRRTPWFPAKMRGKEFTRAKLTGMLSKAGKFFQKLEKCVKPRLGWIASRPGYRMMAVLVIIMSLLMCIPIPGTNTFPAMVIFLIGVGLSEDDGLLAIAACAVGTVAVMIYAAMIYILIVYGWEGLQQVKDFIKQMLGLE